MGWARPPEVIGRLSRSRGSTVAARALGGAGGIDRPGGKDAIGGAPWLVSRRCLNGLRAVKPCDDAAGDGVGHARKDDRDRPRLPLERDGRRGPVCHDDVVLQVDQLLRERSYPIGVTAAPSKVHPHVAAIRPTQVRKRLRERRDASLS